jgi:hypothetical protein
MQRLFLVLVCGAIALTAQTRPSRQRKPNHGEIISDAEGRVIRDTRHTPVDPLIERARQAAVDYVQTLPNYICEQLTWRFTSKRRPPKWRLKDRVWLELLYLNHREDYRNIKINGKPLKQGSPQDKGTWSIGELATFMLDLMSPSTEAEFMAAGTGGGQEECAFSVRQANSHWRIEFEGQQIRPAYEGTVWIDPRTARLMRMEVQAKDIPADFPMDVLEVTIDYGLVRIAGETLLMPVRAENLACRRYTSFCSRNQTEFKNYRKFTAESTVTTTDSNIKF